MKKLKNSRRHMITAVCLIVGLLVLTTSVYANFDNANGYSNYKDSLKKLFLYTDDVTISAEMEFLLDGEVIMGAEAGIKMNEDGMNEYTKDWDEDGVTQETYMYRHDGKQYRYYPDDNSYYEWTDSWNSRANLLDVDPDEKTFQKAVRFLELSADLLIGDLKNNVVLLSNEDGVREYAVDISTSQMPEIVNAGLSLMFSAFAQDDIDMNYVTYENWADSYEAYFVEQTSQEEYDLWNYGTEDMLAAAGYDSWDEFYEENGEKYDDISYNFDMQYQEIFEDEYNGEGVLYIKEDGSHEHYDTYSDYLYRTGNASNYWYYLFGEDPIIENAKMVVKLNESNELLYNYIEGTLVGTDSAGNRHEATMQITINASDYGSTEYEEFDPAGKTKI